MKDKSLKAKSSADKRRSKAETDQQEIQEASERNANAMLRKEKKRKENKKEDNIESKLSIQKQSF